MQLEVFFFIHRLGFDNPAYEALYLRDEPNEYKRVDHIKRRMECSQNKIQLGSVSKESPCAHFILYHIHVIAYPSTNHVHERTEDEENPDDTEDIEEHVGKCRTPCLSVGREGSQV